MPKRITFCYSLKNSFVTKDMATLSHLGYRLKEIQSPPYRSLLGFVWNRKWEGIKSLCYIPRSVAVVVWFNDYHAFIPLLMARVFRKKSIVIVGGYDAIKDTKLSYGIFLKKGLRQKLARWNYRLASRIWVVHKRLADGCKTAFAQNQTLSGIRTFMPNLQTPIVEVPTGYDPNFWKCEHSKQEKSILTVANITDKRVHNRKGIPTFMALAKQLPDFKFTIVGMNFPNVEVSEMPKNVTVLGKQDPAALKQIYSEHQYYFQGSLIEGLPNVLCEAMLCECIPLGNAVFGIPDAIGETGLVFNGEQDLQKIISFLRSSPIDLGKKARKRIRTQYHQDRRTNHFKTGLAINESL